MSSGPIRVAQVVTVATSVRLMRGWLTRLSSEGYQVEVICSPGTELALLLEGQGVHASHTIRMTRELSPLRDLIALHQLHRAMRVSGFHLVHASTPKAGLLGMLAARLAGVPVRIYTLRGLRLSGTSGLRRLVLWLAEWLAMRTATHVVAISASLAREAAELRLCDAAEVRLIGAGSSNGVDTEHFKRVGVSSAAPLRRELGILPEHVVVGFVGRLVPDKGVRELLDAWPAVRDSEPLARLLLVGDVETHTPLPPDVVRRLEGDSSVIKAGWREDTVACFEAMDLLVLPTYREGFGNVLIEAAAMELPTVATRVTGCVDAVQDGVTGRLVPVQDAVGLAQAVHELVRDPVLRQQMGRAGRERAVRDFRQEDVWAGLLQIYDEALKAAPPRG